MKRRDFLKFSAGAVAAASLTGCSAFEGPSTPAASFEARLDSPDAVSDLAPRKKELFDADWRFKGMPEATILQSATAIKHWLWKKGNPDQAQEFTKPDLDTSTGGWATCESGADTLNGYIGYAWYRATLPAMPKEGRWVSFASVDDNGTVYLNGQKLRSHQGWDTPFTVNLDSAWNSNGPNVLTVLVQNTAGPGGITGAVELGTLPPSQQCNSMDFDDSSWRRVHLPHDYIVEGQYERSANTGHGSLPVFPAWYRKTFIQPAEDQGKHVWLYFEGVFRKARVFLNGQEVAYHSGGYTSFHVDISRHLRYGQKNVLAVHVDPTEFEGWWYEGGGIYRHVWLNVADPVHVEPWGVYVTSKVHDETGKPSATLAIETRLTNGSQFDRVCEVVSEIISPDGQVAGSTKSYHTIAAGANFKAEQTVHLAHAQLWSLEQRHLYHLKTTLSANGKVVDRHVQRFGIRTIRFDADKGFFLNEKPVKLQGVCNHQDFAGVGIGIPDSLFYYRMQRLKDFGCNAIRCSHNPMTPAMYDACDELGLLVMDENRHPGDAATVKSYIGQPYHDTWHVETMVLRDRNHPSIIMWSMWNEEWGIQGSPFGREMMQTLMDAVHKHDRTRPISCAANQGIGEGWMIGMGASEDLLGVNYNYQDYDWLHKKYPNKPIFGSEIGSNLSCRGVYHTNRETAHLSSYMAPDGSWQPLGARAFVAGGFYWTGFDYRGETTPFGWPEINSNFGFLDMCGFPKDSAFYWKSWWSTEPVLHIFPHWNWPGKEGQNVPVWCFSNCDEVELFVNGKSQGRKTMEKFRHLQWDHVTYQPGKVEAHGYTGGKLVATTVVETTGAPAALRLRADSPQLIADGEDTVAIEVAVVDAQGRVVPTADNMVHFAARGRGKLAGVGNGDPACHEPNQANYRSAFAGLCMVLVKAGEKPGSVLLEARADGLPTARLTFDVVADKT